jgi:hypothetical protein
MSKLVQSWYDRNTLTRAGIVWGTVILLVLVVFWYVNQNVSFTSMDTAHTVNTVHLVIMYLDGAAWAMVLIGLASDFFKKRVKKDDSRVKMADGIWMIKK